jgi:hypothetical protein
MVPTPGQGQVEGGGGAQASRSYHQHLSRQELALAHRAHLGHDDVARVAQHLLRGQHLATGDGWDDGHLVAVLHRCLRPLQGVDLLIVEVDVDVGGDMPLLVEDHVGQGGEVTCQVL